MRLRTDSKNSLPSGRTRSDDGFPVRCSREEVKIESWKARDRMSW